MNNRRRFLTKDEVKSLGMELTNLTTDDILALWLPMRGLSDSLGTSYISFKYRRKNHSDLLFRTSGSSAYSSLGYDYTNYPVKLNFELLSCSWEYKKSNSYGKSVGYSINFTSVPSYTSNGYSYYSGNLKITDMVGGRCRLVYKN